MESFSISDLKGLDEVAEAFVARFDAPGIFLLFGDMGVGKTTFVKAVCKQMGMEATSSPTFSIVNHYKAGNREVYHFDLYRLRSLEEALDMGMEEYFDREAYIFIEWPQVVESILPEGCHSIRLSEEEGVRTLQF